MNTAPDITKKLADLQVQKGTVLKVLENPTKHSPDEVRRVIGIANTVVLPQLKEIMAGQWETVPAGTANQIHAHIEGLVKGLSETDK